MMLGQADLGLRMARWWARGVEVLEYRHTQWQAVWVEATGTEPPILSNEDGDDMRILGHPPTRTGGPRGLAEIQQCGRGQVIRRTKSRTAAWKPVRPFVPGERRAPGHWD